MQMEHDESEVLADRVGIPQKVWDAVFGRGWVVNRTGPWHVRGRVPQLMLRVLEHGVFIGRPEGIVRGPGVAGGVDYQPAHQEYVAAHDLEAQAPEIVKWMLVARRRQFRWCADCWEHTPPELMAGDVCSDCAGRGPVPGR